MGGLWQCNGMKVKRSTERNEQAQIKRIKYIPPSKPNARMVPEYPKVVYQLGKSLSSVPLRSRGYLMHLDKLASRQQLV